MLPHTPENQQVQRLHQGFGPSFGECSLRYISALRDGALLVLLALSLNVLASIGMVLAELLLPPLPESSPASGSEPLAIASMLYLVAMLVSAAAGVMGWWWLTTPDPEESLSAHPPHSRPVLRGVVIVHALLMVALMGGPFLVAALAASAGPAAVVGSSLVVIVALLLCTVVAMVVKFFATMSYVRWIAHRLPDETLDASAARFMWLGPVLVTLGSLIIVGPLIAVIMYFGLIFKTWASLCEIAKSRREQLEATTPPPQNMAA